MTKYKCLKCGKEVNELTTKVRCPKCGFRIFVKAKSKKVKRVQAR